MKRAVETSQMLHSEARTERAPALVDEEVEITAGGGMEG